MKILELKNIYTRFGQNQIHKGATLSLCENETLGLLGGSGSGKSVLLRSIVGLEKVESGEILFKGKRIDHLPEEKMTNVRLRIAYSFQSGALFDSMNVFENLAWPLKQHYKLTKVDLAYKVEEALKLVGLENAKFLMPSDLSGGMQKRIGLARSLMLEPEIMLYDEPTAGLDPKNTANIINVIKDLKQIKKIASIFVTHDIAAAMDICDRIAILSEGKIRFSGTPQDMKNSTEDFIKDFFAMEGITHADN